MESGGKCGLFTRLEGIAAVSGAFAGRNLEEIHA